VESDPLLISDCSVETAVLVGDIGDTQSIMGSPKTCSTKSDIVHIQEQREYHFRKENTIKRGT